jgi:O-antigen/teichoic acid export membrane protein
MLHKLSPNLKKIIASIGWLSVERILGMAVSLFVVTYVIRYLGAKDFGRLSYSISLVGLFEAFSKLGLDSIVIRNLVREEKSSDEILGTTFFLKLAGSLVTIGAIVCVSLQMDGYSQTSAITVIVACTLLFGAIDTIDYWFQSQVISRPLAFLRITQLIVSSIIKILLIQFKYPLIYFAWAILVEYIFKTIGIVWCYVLQGRKIFNWKFDLEQARKLLKNSYPLILSGAMATLYLKIDQVMLHQMSGDKELGYYATAIKFSEIWYFIPSIICASIFPSIVRAREDSRADYYRKIQELYDFMSWLAIVIVIIMTLSAGTIVSITVGSENARSADILLWHIWAIPFVFIGIASHQWFIAENLIQFPLISTTLGAFSNIAINYYLIPYNGGVGAAIATVISYALTSYALCLVYPVLRKNGLMMLFALFIPFRLQRNIFYINKIKKML